MNRTSEVQIRNNHATRIGKVIVWSHPRTAKRSPLLPKTWNTLSMCTLIIPFVVMVVMVVILWKF